MESDSPELDSSAIVAIDARKYSVISFDEAQRLSWCIKQGSRLRPRGRKRRHLNEDPDDNQQEIKFERLVDSVFANGILYFRTSFIVTFTFFVLL